MKNCLVSKLKELVKNDNMPYLNNLVINVNSVSNPQSLAFAFAITTTKATEVEIVGDGYFTDASMETNLGKISTIAANDMASLRFSNGNYKIKLPIDCIKAFETHSQGVPSQISLWQVDGLDYKRMFMYSTPETVFFPDLNRYMETLGYQRALTKIKIFNVGTGEYADMTVDEVIQKTVEQGNEYNFMFYFPGKDHYGTSAYDRNIHIVTPGSYYEVYNTADTTLLYSAQKVGNLWKFIDN